MQEFADAIMLPIICVRFKIDPLIKLIIDKNGRMWGMS